MSAGRISEGSSFDEGSGKISSAGDLFRRYPGAFCGIGAEERGQGSAIAENLLEISRLKTPVVSIFIGEGGSGGALALACGDEVWMMENAVYSVLSPEGFASILWKDKKCAPEAADKMKLTAEDVVAAQAAERMIKDRKN